MLQSTIVLSVAHYRCTKALWSNGVQVSKLDSPTLVSSRCVMNALSTHALYIVDSASSVSSYQG